MDKIVIRRGKSEDAEDFSELVLSAAPMALSYLLGPDVKNLIKNLSRHPRNYYSFEHSYFIEVNGEIAGTALAYNYEQKKREYLRTLLLGLKYLKWVFFTQLPYIRESEHIIVQIAEGDCYLNSIAMYPKFRGRGLGTRLIGVVEEDARKTGSKRIVLDVDINNERAIKLYERLGYSIEQKSPIFKIKDRNFEFFKMVKDIKKNVMLL